MFFSGARKRDDGRSALSNQSDVLEEMPPRVDMQKWVELRGRDWEAYRDAVAAGNVMAMRRAAYAPGHPAHAAKLGRLVEIVRKRRPTGARSWSSPISGTCSTPLPPSSAERRSAR